MKLKLTAYTIAVATVWTVCLIGVGLAVLLVGVPQSQAAEQARRDMQESRQRLEWALDAGEGDVLSRLEEHWNRTRELVDQFSCPAANESELIFKIGQIAHALGIERFTSRSPDRSPEQTLDSADSVKEATLTVEFESDYPTLTAFVNSLERHWPRLFVESINLRRLGNEAQNPATQLTITYFVRKDPREKDKGIAGAF